MRLKSGWYWVCVNIDLQPSVYSIHQMIGSMRALRDEVDAETWKQIRKDYRRNGCYYCIGETPGCGLYLIS